MELIICSKRSLGMIIKHITENSYYYAVFEIKRNPVTFLSEIGLDCYRVVNEYNENFMNIENQCFLPYEEYSTALYIVNVGIQSTRKIKEDIRLQTKLSYQNYSFLPVKNSTNIFKFYNYFFRIDNRVRKKTAVVIQHDGYGDGILVLTVLRAWIYSKKNKQSDIIVYHMYSASHHLSHLFLKECKNLMYPLTDQFEFLDDPKQRIILEELKESTVVNISNNYIHSAFTKVKELALLLEMDYISNLLDYQFSFLPISKNILDKILYLKKQKKFVISVQFYTYHDKDTFVKRSYLPVLAQQFIDLCRENQIGVINLSEYDSYKFNVDIDASYLSVNELFTVINQVDLVVGIDSCCSHIAGVLKKKNLVLLGKIINKVSQRPLSMNYTIISKDGDINTIKPADIFCVLCRIQNEEIILSPDIKEEYDYSFDVKCI